MAGARNRIEAVNELWLADMKHSVISSSSALIQLQRFVNWTAHEGIRGPTGPCTIRKNRGELS